MDCFVKELIGFDCIGCGITRAIIALMNGDPGTSFTHFPALIPFMLSLLFVGIGQYYNSKAITILKNVAITGGIVLLLGKYIINFI